MPRARCSLRGPAAGQARRRWTRRRRLPARSCSGVRRRGAIVEGSRRRRRCTSMRHATCPNVAETERLGNRPATARAPFTRHVHTRPTVHRLRSRPTAPSGRAAKLSKPKYLPLLSYMKTCLYNLFILPAIDIKNGVGVIRVDKVHLSLISI